MSENTEKPIEIKKDQKEINLTDANWLFLKHLRLGASIPDAYALAGYKSDTLNAPYSLYHSIKKKLEAIVQADGFDKLRLSLEMEKVLSLPLAETKTEVTFGEKLKALRLAHTIMSDNEQKSPQASFTMIVIESGQPTSLKVDPSKVIEVEAIVDPKA